MFIYLPLCVTYWAKAFTHVVAFYSPAISWHGYHRYHVIDEKTEAQGIIPEVCTQACLMTTYALTLATSWKRWVVIGWKEVKCYPKKLVVQVDQETSACQQLTWINNLKFLLTTNSGEWGCCQEHVSKLQFLWSEVCGFVDRLCH